MAEITLWRGAVRAQIFAEEGTPLEAILPEVAMPCGGNHTCGKCRVHAEGALSAVSDEERVLLGEDALARGTRLACFAAVAGDCTVRVQQSDIETLSWAKMPPVQARGAGYGLAADIGTTTVAVRLYHCATGAPLAEALEGNRQASFGADVISRIGNAAQGDAQALSDTIRAQLADMAARCCAQADVSEISSAVVTGNTTMLHFYENLDAAGIACAPFTASSLFGACSAAPLAGAPTYLPPCIGAYVGADIVCALLAAEMPKHPDRCALLADIGTNGEIALMKNGRLYCCSTAAGPAFEGAGLHQGMRAAAGAITDVALAKNGSVQVQTLGSVPAVGVCGSGALDALRVMLALGVMDGAGALQRDYCGAGAMTEWDGQPAWQLPGTAVCITQRDVRQLQLAKSAICAGIRTLLAHTQTDVCDVESFYIAGGFGHSMSAASAAKIGLFPPELAPRVHVIGNGALAGAAMLLLDPARRADAAQIQRTAEELALSASAVFMDFYIDGMLFEEDE